MSSSLEGGRERDSGHIRFALTAITGNFAGSSVKGEIYTAGGSAGGRPCLPHPGEDEPKEKKGKLGSASHRRHVFTERGGRGAAGAGQPCIPASPSTAHHKEASHPCCFASRTARIYPLEPILQRTMLIPPFFLNYYYFFFSAGMRPRGFSLPSSTPTIGMLFPPPFDWKAEAKQSERSA